MCRLFFCFCLLTIVHSSYAQSNLLKGVIINNNGDSINGLIDYRNWKNNPQTISFIAGNGKKTRYDAAGIKGFYIPSVQETYTSFKTTMDHLPAEADDAINHRTPDSAGVKEYVFLYRLIGSNDLQLYSYLDTYKEHYFFSSKTDSLQELIRHFQMDDSSHQVIEDASYRQQLYSLFKDCPEQAQKSLTVNYDKEAIQKLFIQYLQCHSPGSELDSKKSEKVKMVFGIMGGVTFNHFGFDGPGFDFIKGNFSNQVAAIGGLSIDFTLPRNLNSWHVLTELLYKTYRTGNNYTAPYGNGYNVTGEVKLKFSYIQLNVLARYIFQTKSQVKPFLNAGIGYASMLAEQENHQHAIYSFGRIDDVTAFDPPRKFEIPVTIGFGVSIKKIQPEFRYTRGKKGFSYYDDLNVNPSSWQIIFRYQFIK